MTGRRLLIANRGEVAARIAQSANDLGYTCIGVRARGDHGLYLGRMDSVVELDVAGAAAYLDIEGMVTAARNEGCDAVHPGWGFLAENAEFAASLQQAGIGFIGPEAEHLRLFGDKVEARAFAERCGVGVLEATGVLSDGSELESMLERHGRVILKAAGGGGGRGMRVLDAGADLLAGLEACRQEAMNAFGVDAIFAEQYLSDARHIEVQVLADAQGGVMTLGERDCSLQRRHQKLIEMAPAPKLTDEQRGALASAAEVMAKTIGYRGLGTFEFLVDRDSGACYFIEANPRLQVEHTVTELVFGLDLVALQLRVSEGKSLDDLGLRPLPTPRGSAVQMRINAERIEPDGTLNAAGGSLDTFDVPTGPGVRVDTGFRRGDSVNPAFDTLVAKIVVTSQESDPAAVLGRAARALGELRIAGVDTNVGLIAALIRRENVRSGEWHTGLVDQSLRSLLDEAEAFVPAAAGHSTSPPDEARVVLEVPPEWHLIAAPMPSSVVSLAVEEGEVVRAGQPLAVLESMKMHHVVESTHGGRVMRVLVQTGAVLSANDPIVWVLPLEEAGERFQSSTSIDLDASRADLDEVLRRHALGQDDARSDAVEKRRKVGGRTARENIADLLDEGSFIEYGALAIAAQRRRRPLEDLMSRTPADGMVAGVGTVNAEWFGDESARCAALAYDYTVLAGTQGHVNHKKKDRLFELAEEWALPVVFFTEGGGGRPGDVDTDDLIMSWLDIKTFTTWPRLSGVAPRIAVNFGRCFAGNAVIFGCADITIATANSNIGLAGPAMIEGGGLGRFTPEEIGPIDVQTANGVVDLAVADEEEATAAARQVLGYFQGSISQWTAPDQRLLRHVIPEDRLRVYDVRELIRGLADEGSVLELRRDYGFGLITAFVRIEGRPFGLIANDPRHLGGAIDGEGGEKGARFLQLCDVYGLPVVSLCDTPGYMVGPESEKTAAVRRGSRLILASANLRVPLFTVVVRKAYGLGAQAMAGGGLHEPFFSVAWPTAELGPMGLEGAVELGFRKELDAVPDGPERRALYEKLVAQMYDKGKGVSVAQAFELDAVIDPADTRRWLLAGLRSTSAVERPLRPFVDVW